MGGDSTFLCQDVRGDWKEKTLDHTSRSLNSAVYRGKETCKAAQNLTTGSTQVCTPAVWTPPFWAEEMQLNGFSNRDVVTKCAADKTMRGGSYSM